MAFFFGKSKKGQASALPAATRDIQSSHGAESRIPTATNLDGSRDGLLRRGTVGTQQSPQASSVNSSFTSTPSMKTPEPDVKMRNRADSDLNVSSCRLESEFAIANRSCSLGPDPPVASLLRQNRRTRGLSGNWTSLPASLPSRDTALPPTPSLPKKDGST